MQTITVDLAQFKLMQDRIAELEAALREMMLTCSDQAVLREEARQAFLVAERLLVGDLPEIRR